MSDYTVQTCSPEEAEAILARLGSPQQAKAQMLRGFVDAWAREADGSVAWEIHQPNIITDLARRRFFSFSFITGLFLVTSPSAETPTVGRTSLLDDGNASSSQASAGILPTYDSLTLTKTWANTFAAPAANRTVGTIGLASITRSSNLGLYALLAYTLLSPTKVQTTSQTLEVQYRITLTPSY